MEKVTDAVGKTLLFILWQADLFLLMEIPPAVDQLPDALLRLVPVQLNGGISFEAGFLVLPGIPNPFAVMPLYPFLFCL